MEVAQQRTIANCPATITWWLDTMLSITNLDIVFKHATKNTTTFSILETIGKVLTYLATTNWSKSHQPDGSFSRL